MRKSGRGKIQPPRFAHDRRERAGGKTYGAQGAAIVQVVSAAQEVGELYAAPPDAVAEPHLRVVVPQVRAPEVVRLQRHPAAGQPDRAHQVASARISAEPSFTEFCTRELACRRNWPGKLTDSNE